MAFPTDLCPHECQSLGFHSKTPSCKTPTNSTVVGCSAQVQAFECLKDTHTFLLFHQAMLFTAKLIYLNQTISGFEPESPVHFSTWTWTAGPFQDLNLNRQSISGLESERPVTVLTLYNKSTRQAMYLERNTEAYLRKHSGSGKAVRITYLIVCL